MPVPRDEAASVPVVAVVLLVAITFALGALVVVKDFGGLRKNLERSANEPPPDTGLYAQHDDAYMLEPLGPDAVPFARSALVVTADGVESTHPVALLAPQLPVGATQWEPGQPVCIAGADPDCLVGPADEVAVRLVSMDAIVTELPSLPALP